MHYIMLIIMHCTSVTLSESILYLLRYYPAQTLFLLFTVGFDMPPQVTTGAEDSIIGTVNGMEEVAMHVFSILTLVVAKQEFELTVEFNSQRCFNSCVQYSYHVSSITVQLQAF